MVKSGQKVSEIEKSSTDCYIKGARTNSKPSSNKGSCANRPPQKRSAQGSKFFFMYIKLRC